MTDSEIRLNLIAWFEKQGFEVFDKSSGQGVPRFSRLDLLKAGKLTTCLVKLSKNGMGRIGFGKRKDGKWMPLSNFEQVAYVFQSPTALHELQVQIYKASDIEEAFNTSYDAVAAEGNENYEIWLSPQCEKEKGTRHLGSGFADKAMLSDVISLQQQFPSETPVASNQNDQQRSSKSSTLEAAKRMIAESLGVSIQNIEIEVKVTL